MLQSMTGFASHRASLRLKAAEETTISIELKSINSRFFEASFKLPSSLLFLEVPITNILKQKLIRGRVFISLRLGGTGGALETVVPVLKLARDYVTAARLIKKELKVPGEITISDVLALPDIFSFEQGDVGKKIESTILKMVEIALDQLVAVRKAEGSRLQKDLQKRFDLCAKSIEKIKKHFDQFIKKEKEAAKKLLAFSKKGDQESEKLLGEKYELINKIDVNEEIVRFRSHLKGANELLTSRLEDKGKRFEFMIQELGREINTVAAKCSHFEISSLAVDTKVELEKVREQVQNIV